MIFQVLKQSTTMPTLPKTTGKLISRQHGTAVFLSSSTSDKSRLAKQVICNTKRSFGVLANEPLVLNNNVHKRGMYNVPTELGIAYLSPGNPSTMAFLGTRLKSSSAAFRVQCDEDDGFANGTRVDDTGRSVQEAWMVNLGRGDEKWLTGPRDKEWFTGMAPDTCPGECS